MGKSSPSPPPAPNPSQQIAAQSAANKEAVDESAKVNAVDQTTPYGTVTYQKDANGLPTSQVTTLAPGQQQQLDQQTALSNALLGKASGEVQYLPTDQFTTANLPQQPGTGDYSTQTAATQKAAYDQIMALQQPQFDQQQRTLDQNVADRGLPIDGEAATTLQGNLSRSQNDATTNAANTAVQTGNQEQQALFGEGSNIHQQALSDALTQRNQPFNEMSAYIQGAPAMGMPQASPIPSYQMQPANAMGAYQNAYQGQLNNYNQQVAMQNNSLSGMYGLAGNAAMAAGMFSDRRLKRDIQPVGVHKGLIWYAFRYLWSPVLHFGVMAQEAVKKFPDAVFTVGGYLAVDYRKLEA